MPETEFNEQYARIGRRSAEIQIPSMNSGYIHGKTAEMM